jgi:hypothetical protein
MDEIGNEELAPRHDEGLRARLELWLWEHLQPMWQWEYRWNHPWATEWRTRLPFLCDLANWLTGGRAHD